MPEGLELADHYFPVKLDPGVSLKRRAARTNNADLEAGIVPAPVQHGFRRHRFHQARRPEGHSARGNAQGGNDRLPPNTGGRTTTRRDERQEPCAER